MSIIIIIIIIIAVVVVEVVTLALLYDPLAFSGAFLLLIFLLILIFYKNLKNILRFLSNWNKSWVYKLKFSICVLKAISALPFSIV